MDSLKPALKPCTFCTHGDENDFLLAKYGEAFGSKNGLRLDACIWTSETEPHITVDVSLYDREIMYGAIPISYCPKCGRKLT